MASDPPGWYRDPKRPGLPRYWDGQAWVDVDQVVDGHPDRSLPGQGQAALSPSRSALRVVAQRRSTEDSMAATIDEVDEGGPEQLDVSPSTSEPEPRQD
jgi:hypothetical protein